jgi:ubiquinone/menaquinone biosynthesis C-methylase UbiE
MADISRLPFQDGVFDGIISGYTIQHIDEAQQSEAVASSIVFSNRAVIFASLQPCKQVVLTAR